MSEAAGVVRVPGSTRKICQLTGELDRSLGQHHPAFNRTETRFGLRGTDLGASFEHKGRCWLLFGDTHPSGPNTDYRPIDGDSIAWTEDRIPAGGFRLEFLTAPDGKYLAPSAPGVSINGFEVPTGGFSAHGSMYVFYTTDARFPTGGAVMARSVLLRSDDDGRSFRTLYTLSRDRVIYVSPAVVESRRWSGLPEKRGRGVLMWSASTQYRRSDPYLSYLPLQEVEDRGALRVFAGRDAAGRPEWSEQEADAAPLFHHPCIGELCVSWNPFLERWLMLYNSGGTPGPRGILFRSAEKPWGPWSEPQMLFDPWADGGYGHFMHVSFKAERRDEVHDPGKEDVWGGEYAPYVVDRYTTGTRGRTTLYWLMSTWNPYNVVLMTSTLERAGGTRIRC
jgi:hypothetical protein